MSLLSDSMEDFIMMDRTTMPDSYGGYTSVWRDGAVFKAAAVLDTSIQARIGEKQGVTALYTITTSKVLCVGMGDIGSNVARKMHALGAEVIGIRRNV